MRAMRSGGFIKINPGKRVSVQPNRKLFVKFRLIKKNKLLLTFKNAKLGLQMS